MTRATGSRIKRNSRTWSRTFLEDNIRLKTSQTLTFTRLGVSFLIWIQRALLGSKLILYRRKLRMRSLAWGPSKLLVLMGFMPCFFRLSGILLVIPFVSSLRIAFRIRQRLIRLIWRMLFLYLKWITLTRLGCSARLPFATWYIKP